MAFQADIAGAGNSASSALAIVGSISKGVTAAGTTQLTATKLSSALNLVTTVPASSGVMLPTMFDSDLCVVMNKGANALSVYPTKDHNIDGAANNTPVTVNAGVIAYFWGTGSGNYSSDIAGISSNPTFAGLTVTGNLTVNGNATLGDAVMDSHTITGAVTITDDGIALVLQRSGGGDLGRLVPQAAGSGYLVDVTNAAQSDYEPYSVVAEHIAFLARTGVATFAEIVRVTSAGLTLQTGQHLVPNGSASAPS